MLVCAQLFEGGKHILANMNKMMVIFTSVFVDLVGMERI